MCPTWDERFFNEFVSFIIKALYLYDNGRKEETLIYWKCSKHIQIDITHTYDTHIW